MKTLIKISFLLLSAMMMGYGAFAQPYSVGGTSGLQWELRIDTLFITHDATTNDSVIPSYSTAGATPWASHMTYIKAVVMDNVTGIGSQAIAEMPALEYVCVPATVDSIYAGAFSNSRNIREILFLGVTPPRVDALAFDILSGSTILFLVPEGSYNAYEIAFSGIQNITIVPMQPSDIIRELKEDTAHYRDTIRILRRDTARMREDSIHLRDTIVMLQGDTARLRADSVYLRDTIGFLKIDTAAYRQHVRDLQQDSVFLTADTARLRADSVHLRDTIGFLKIDTATYRQHVRDLQHDSAALASDTALLRDTIRQYSQTITQMATELSTLLTVNQPSMTAPTCTCVSATSSLQACWTTTGANDTLDIRPDASCTGIPIIPDKFAITEFPWGSQSGNINKVYLDGVTFIGANAFAGMTLSEITIPNSVDSINEYAFQNANMGQMRMVKPIPPATHANAFLTATYSNARLIVPEGTQSAWTSTPWSNFSGIKQPSDIIAALELDTMHYRDTISTLRDSIVTLHDTIAALHDTIGLLSDSIIVLWDTIRLLHDTIIFWRDSSNYYKGMLSISSSPCIDYFQHMNRLIADSILLRDTIGLLKLDTARYLQHIRLLVQDSTTLVGDTMRYRLHIRNLTADSTFLVNDTAVSHSRIRSLALDSAALAQDTAMLHSLIVQLQADTSYLAELIRQSGTGAMYAELQQARSHIYRLQVDSARLSADTANKQQTINRMKLDSIIYADSIVRLHNTIADMQRTIDSLTASVARHADTIRDLRQKLAALDTPYAAYPDFSVYVAAFDYMFMLNISMLKKDYPTIFAGNAIMYRWWRYNQSGNDILLGEGSSIKTNTNDDAFFYFTIEVDGKRYKSTMYHHSLNTPPSASAMQVYPSVLNRGETFMLTNDAAADALTLVQIYTISGMLVDEQAAAGSNCAMAAPWMPGIYLVKAGGEVRKIVVE
jgi:uncharacterized coiled-coil protein SlyX